MTKKYCLFMSILCTLRISQFTIKTTFKLITNRIKINLKIQYTYIYRQINK